MQCRGNIGVFEAWLRVKLGLTVVIGKLIFVRELDPQAAQFIDMEHGSRECSWDLFTHRLQDFQDQSFIPRGA